MTAIDTSVCIPALLADHEAHGICRRAAHGTSIPSHALVESYAVLTRLPSGFRVEASVAAQLLGRWFGPDLVLPAPAKLQKSIIQQLQDYGVSGGSTYDALVALVAKSHGEELLTRDTRAVPTYEAVGVRFRVLEGPTK